MHETSIELGVNVVLENWPQQPYRAGEFMEGESATLEVPLELYPKPTRDQIIWKITDNLGQTIKLKSGKLWVSCI